MCHVILVLLLAIKFSFVNSHSCGVSNLGVSFREVGKAEWNFTRVEGCISDASFPGRKIIHIRITEAVRYILDPKFINHMQFLEEIYIDKSQVETILPGAFSDLPRLKKINLSNNVINKIYKGVFNIHPTLQILRLHLNKISYIEDGAFANLPNLREISLSENNLSYVRKEWFINTTYIESFNMFNNSIQKIPSGMFHGWSRLRGVYLNSNAISVIEGELFRNNPEVITAVGLHHNRLQSIHPNIFPVSVHIRYLSLSGNLFNYLPEAFLWNVRVRNIAKYGNPFSCHCLEKINRIFLERGVTVDDSTKSNAAFCKDDAAPVCAFPSNRSEGCVEAVDEELTRRYLSYLKKKSLR